MPSKFAPGSKRALAESRKPKKGGTAGAAAKTGATCGAKKRGGGLCNLASGWGTNHPGIGKCKMHGGSVPNHVKAAAKEEYRTLLGTPIEINPYEALLWCIKIRAGEVKWLSEKMKDLQEKDWIEDTLVGKQFHLFARERQAAMRDLARYTQMAVSLGIAERVVKLAETYGELLANYTQGLLEDLWPHLDEEGRAKAPAIVRGRMLLIEEGSAIPELEAGDIEDADYQAVA